jgi:hypothetical protein
MPKLTVDTSPSLTTFGLVMEGMGRSDAEPMEGVPLAISEC